jgi:hypothetical protein
MNKGKFSIVWLALLGAAVCGPALAASAKPDPRTMMTGQWNRYPEIDEQPNPAFPPPPPIPPPPLKPQYQAEYEARRKACRRGRQAGSLSIRTTQHVCLMACPR